ncbi:DUF2530 domain-containing protein [Aldersonia kunmingensis]|uniref:DUF2530 domain-containing protein n=1 Tax=Aldersonia kunmingensis TaxID=408066 RepID=UPI00082DFAFA|nr:DUF2530 domain-containing protein [Aldersonia kunmingensis]
MSETPRESSAGTATVPEIPARLIDPRPVLAIGMLCWLVATIVVFASGDTWEAARPTCLMGLAVGVLAYTVYWIQRRGVRRGSKGAQVGIE